MAYILVQVDDTSKAGTYGIAIVQISSLQARVSLMVEGFGDVIFPYLQRI